MAKHKVSELTGALLDAAAAIAEGYKPDSRGYQYHKPPEIIHGVSVPNYVQPGEKDFGFGERYHPSGDWEDGGPIIERESLCLQQWRAGRQDWCSWVADKDDTLAYGATPLEAAMRAFVTSKLGEEVELPS